MRVRVILQSIAFSLAGAALFLLAASPLPIWEVWHFSDWEANDERASLWTALRQMPRYLEVTRNSAQFSLGELHQHNIILGGILFAVGPGIGRFVYWVWVQRRTKTG